MVILQEIHHGAIATTHSSVLSPHLSQVSFGRAIQILAKASSRRIQKGSVGANDRPLKVASQMFVTLAVLVKHIFTQSVSIHPPQQLLVAKLLPKSTCFR
jgi:hypothetical protein